MRIFFIGSVKFSFDTLNFLIDSRAEVVGVMTKEVPINKSDHVDLSIICSDRGIPWRYSSDFNCEDLVSWINSLNPDIIFCFGWSHLLSKEILELTKFGVVGFHPAEIPANRGRHPIIWSLALGLERTASTFFLMNTEADAGPILSQIQVEILESDYANDLYERVTATALHQLDSLLPLLESCTHVLQEQPSLPSNNWRRRTKQDGLIDWRMSSKSIYRLVRALASPYPGAHFVLNELEYKVWSATPLDYKPNNIEPGKVLEITKEGPVIKCGEGAICLTSLSPGLSLKEGMYL